ncbi:hypothetical protein PYW07_000528 [Mythimna separata]|uniref:Amino acid transporter transmembrane domain-containing protein n=1 Tax=Mythimna separata TaxID=271217 RepID=A0AAD7Z323_MYTSE|nr:hypothetical protein PYW07_000528 [Mythimna separata]
MTDPTPTGSKSKAVEPKSSGSKTISQRPSLMNISPSKVPSKVASKVMSVVDVSKDAIMSPLKKLTGKEEEEEYDPHKHRNVPNPTTYMQTMTHMLKACFGTGMLAVPHAFSRLGIIFGTLFCIFLGFFAAYCIQLLILAMYQVAKKKKVGYLTYPKTMRVALKDGPPCMRWTAVPFALSVDTFLLLWQFGVCTVFLVFVAENINKVLNICGVFWSLRVIICCLYPPLFLMSMPKNLKLLAPLSTFSNACNMFGICLVFYYLIHDDLEIDEEVFKLKSLMDIPVFIGIVLYAIEAVAVILALEYNMQNPKEFTGWCGLFSIGMVIIVAIYTSLGVFGYLRYGMDVKASITLNLPISDKKALVAVSAFAATIFTSYPLQNYVAWEISYNIIQNKVSPANRKTADYALRALCSTFPFVLAVAAPTLGPFIGLIGSLCLTTGAILLPAVLDLSVFYPDKYGPLNYKLFTDILIIIFSGFCCFSGCYVSLLEMVESLK